MAETPNLASKTARFENLLRKNRDEMISKFPSKLISSCQSKPSESRKECEDNILIAQNYDHSHMGLSIKPFNSTDSNGILSGAPHRYRSQLFGHVVYYPVVANKINDSEEWFLSSINFEGFSLFIKKSSIDSKLTI